MRKKELILDEKSYLKMIFGITPEKFQFRKKNFFYEFINQFNLILDIPIYSQKIKKVENSFEKIFNFNHKFFFFF